MTPQRRITLRVTNVVLSRPGDDGFVTEFAGWAGLEVGTELEPPETAAPVTAARIVIVLAR